MEHNAEAELAEAYFNSWQSALAAIAEKDREIEQLEAENDNMRKIFDGLMAILPPEYFVKEDGDAIPVAPAQTPETDPDP